MKRVIALLLCTLMVISTLTFVSVSAQEEAEFDEIIEINSWDEFKTAFEGLPKYSFGSYKMVLMQDLSMSAADLTESATSMVEVSILGNNVEFDFNGHTLYCEDNVSDSDTHIVFYDFITVYVSPTHNRGVTLRLTDSVGGGGVKMFSHRAYDNQLAAIRVSATNHYEVKVWDGGEWKYIPQSSSINQNTLIIDGGNYVLTSETEEYGDGTLGYGSYYRGTFIAHHINTVINDGYFEAMGDCMKDDFVNVDMSAREISAFGITRFNKQVEEGSVVINGGEFKSNGYSLHYFDPGAQNYNECDGNQLIPSIYGGIFSGSLGFIGHTFTYSFGDREMNSRPATQMIKSVSSTLFITQDDTIMDINEATFKDLHGSKSLIVLTEDMIGFETNPAVAGEGINLSYPINLSENFSVKYSISDFLNKYVSFTDIKPYVSIKGKNDTDWNTEYVDNKKVSFNAYADGLELILGVELYFGKDMITLSKQFNISVTDEVLPANIITQPESVKVGVGELGGAIIEAENVAAYQWQIELNGGGWISITDDIAATFTNVRMAGYQSRAFFIVIDALSTFKVRCVLTGTDGSKTNSRAVTITFGDIPQVENFYSYGYYAGGDATFYLWGDMFEKVDWTVVYRSGSTTRFYTLDEFKAASGIKYEVGFKLFGDVYRAVVTFKNVSESISGKYSVGYSVENAIGKINFNPDNVVPFELLQDAPFVNECIEYDSCFEGESLEYSFSATDMVSADWIFETVDEDGIGIAYDIEEMKAMFEECDFVTTFKDGTATLTISNASVELNKYTLYARALGESAGSYAGTTQLVVVEPFVFALVGDVNGDGKINSLDAAWVLKHDAMIISLDDTQLKAADVNGDGKVNSLDAAQILKLDAGIIKEF